MKHNTAQTATRHALMLSEDELRLAVYEYAVRNRPSGCPLPLDPDISTKNYYSVVNAANVTWTE